jgi:hypothetical protein
MRDLECLKSEGIAARTAIPGFIGTLELESDYFS